MTAPAAGRRFPLVTACVLGITAVVTGLQFFYPAVLFNLQRSPQIWKANQWWRLATALLVHDEGWRQIAFNFTAIAIVGTVVERIFGGWRWLILYLSAGLVGELAGAAWQGYGAGNSVAGCGLLGALVAWVMRSDLPIQAKLGAGGIAAGALVLTDRFDIHGPPLLVGMAIGWVMVGGMRSRATHSPASG